MTHPSGTKVPILAPQLVDNAIRQTCNVGDHVSYDDFKKLCYKAWQIDCNDVTTFNSAGECYRTLSEVKPENDNKLKAQACFIDPETGIKECN